MASSLITALVLALPASALTIKRSTADLLPQYDYIIAGGGTSGLTVADSLTEAFPDLSILVVEHGHLANGTDILYPSTGVREPAYTYPINSSAEPGLDGRTFPVTVGRVVGGCSAINAMMFDRGSRADYDAWAEVAGPGYEGWGWDGLIESFRESVTFTPPTDEEVRKWGYTYDEAAAYGKKGAIQAVYPPFQWGIEKIMRAAWAQLNVFATVREAAAGLAVGVIWFPSAQDPKTQTRSYARTAHYDRVADRSNYHLLVGHRVTEVLLSEEGGANEARGVRIQPTDGTDLKTVDVASKKEVILAAGGIHTPGILQRSGLGPRDALEAANVSVKVELPGVGHNFQDHAYVSLVYNMTTNAPGPMDLLKNQTLMQEARREYELNRTGPLTLSGGNSGAFLPFNLLTDDTAALLSNLTTQEPDLYLTPGVHPTVLAGYNRQLSVLKALLSSSEAATFEYPIGAGALIPNVALLKPISRGTVHISPLDPLAEPIVTYRTMTHPIDTTMFVHAARMLRRLYTTPSAQTLGPVELAPGAEVQSDEAWAAWLRASVKPSFFHPVGTASLGPRELGGVVDARLRVWGVGRLRVVDASIMPLIPGTHTSSTVYAVAGKAAGMIIEDGEKEL